MRSKHLFPPIVLAIVAAGLLAGCGSPSGTSETATTASNMPTATTTTDAKLDAAAREADLKAREQELARREAAIEAVRQERPAPAQPEAAPTLEDTRPPVRHYPRGTTEPELEIVWVTVPASTALNVEFVDAASSETSAAGDPVRARLVQDVTMDGWQAFPAGSIVTGTVSAAVPSKKIGGKASLSLAFDRIELPSGELVEIQASLVQEGKGQTKKDAATIGGATAGGAVLGRVIDDGDSKGTAIGAIVGAAVGTAVAANNKTQPVSFEPGMTASLTLADAVRVSVSRPSTPRG